MGGYGSGRWSSKKPTAEHMKRLDLACLHRELLTPGTVSRMTWTHRGDGSGSIEVVANRDELRLIYRTRQGDGPWYDISEAIHFAWTSTRFGGRRQWFVCPGCSRRCRVLLGGTRFRCRNCHVLRYSSQAETRIDRATRAMFKIVRRLDPTAQVNELPSKPKGMRWSTYDRLAERYAAYDAQWGIGVMSLLALRGRSRRKS